MEKQNESYVDLNNQESEFKEWFQNEIEKALKLNESIKSVTYLTLNACDETSVQSRIHSIIKADKAYDLSDAERIESPENVIQFLRESSLDLFKNFEDFNLINNINERIKTKDYISSCDSSVTADQIWSGLLDSISSFTKCMTRFAQKCPGFHKFDNDDITLLVASGVLPLYGLMHRSFYRDNDNCTILANGIQYSRDRMSLLFNKNLVDLCFFLYEKFNSFDLTECETALLYPFVLLSSDANLVKAKDYLISLKSFYRKTLINEFKTNNRDETFAQNLNEFFKVLLITELNKNNYTYHSTQKK